MTGSRKLAVVTGANRGMGFETCRQLGRLGYRVVLTARDFTAGKDAANKLKSEGLVSVRRESTFLRYTANTDALQELLQFLYAECCTRNKALKPQDIVQICK